MSKKLPVIKILFVEDLPSDVELARRVISKENIRYTSQVVDSGAAFREALTGFKPDVVVSDYSVPAFDGMSALRITRSVDRFMPFIMLTGSMNEETAVSCMKAGANDYVIKEHIDRLPFAVTEAIENIRARKDKEEFEARLRESEEKFRNIFEYHSAVKLIIDPVSLKLVEVNNAAAKFYGIEMEKLKKLKYSEISALDPAELKNELEGLLHNKNNHFETKHYRAGDKVCDVEIFNSKVNIGSKEYIHVIIHDIADKKQTEEKLKLVSRSVEQSPVSIVLTDKEGKIEYVNPLFSRLTGFHIDEVIGKTCRILKSGHHNRTFYSNMWRVILEGKDWNGEILNRKKDGSLYWENTLISPIVDQNGKITHFVSIREDMTEKKKMIEELIAAKVKAEESDRLKSAFLTNMSHEIRTPMNGIMGFLELLEDSLLTPDQREEYIEIVRKSSERLLNTINDLVEISRIEAEQTDTRLTDIRIDEVMDYFEQFFGREAKLKNLEFKVSCKMPPGTESIVSDKIKLESILMNLLKNAMKFTDEGHIEFGCYPDRDSNIVFYVSDTGKGISPDKKDIIFDRFVQADLNLTRGYEGTGLGLSISKAYAELLGGNIWVESEPGKGSTFYLTIPPRDDTGKSSEQERPEMEKGQILHHDNDDITLLVVEDDETSFAYIEFVCTEVGYKIIYAQNGQEAVDLLKEHPEIRLVLMDLKMPVMDGYEATRIIREFNTAIPVLAQTAYGLPGDKDLALKAGCNAYITKPINQSRLLKLIEQYL